MQEEPRIIIREVMDEFNMLAGWMVAAPEGWRAQTTDDGSFTIHKEGHPSYVLKVNSETGNIHWSRVGPREQFNLDTGALQ